MRLRKKIFYYRRFWVIIFLGVLLFYERAWVFNHLFWDQAMEPPSTIGGIPVHTDYLPKGIPGRPGTKRKIAYIIIHETDNTDPNATALAHNHYLHQIARVKKLSWHYTVDDTEIYHHVPDNEIAFNAGDRYRPNGGNMQGIAIEMCVNQGGNYEKTLHNAAKLTAYLLKTYHLPITSVKKHQDFSGKLCPSRLIAENRWGEFLILVRHELE